MQSLDNFREDTEQFIRDANRIDDSAKQAQSIRTKKTFIKSTVISNPTVKKAVGRSFGRAVKKSVSGAPITGRKSVLY